VIVAMSVNPGGEWCVSARSPRTARHDLCRCRVSESFPRAIVESLRDLIAVLNPGGIYGSSGSATSILSRSSEYGSRLSVKVEWGHTFVLRRAARGQKTRREARLSFFDTARVPSRPYPRRSAAEQRRSDPIALDPPKPDDLRLNGVRPSIFSRSSKKGREWGHTIS
jgi:hypothetical protein